MEASENMRTQPMPNRRVKDDAMIAKIDSFFETERQMSDEDRVSEGLQWGVEHGFVTEDERDAYLRAYHLGYMHSLGNSAMIQSEIVKE